FDVRLSDAPTGNGMSALLTSDTGGFAIVGNDTVATSSSNSGVLGNTTSGFYGVQGIASGNAFDGVFGLGNAAGIGGVFGLASRGDGVDGSASTGAGVSGVSTSGNGVTGSSTNTDGTDGFTSNPSATQQARSGVFGQDISSDGGTGNFGVTGAST